MSEPNRFLYFLISGVSLMASTGCDGVTFTLICEPLRDCLDIEDTEPIVEPSAPKPKAEKERWCLMEGCKTARLYCNRMEGRELTRGGGGGSQGALLTGRITKLTPSCSCCLEFLKNLVVQRKRVVPVFFSF